MYISLSFAYTHTLSLHFSFDGFLQVFARKNVKLPVNFETWKYEIKKPTNFGFLRKKKQLGFEKPFLMYSDASLKDDLSKLLL